MKEKEKFIGLNVSPEIYNKLKEKSIKDERPIASIVRRIIANTLEKEKLPKD